ncbi:MAG: peptidoglycan-associated lipoprotein Pal [Calditrichaceae bacterium]
MKVRIILSIVTSFAFLVILSGCHKAATKITQPVKQVVETPVEVEKPVEEVETDSDANAKTKVELRFAEIYFDYDKFEITSTARQTLAGYARSLKENPNVKLLIEGHCDERGTIEYNLALGERRADSVKKYLVNSGVESSRLSTISYGKERPVVLGTGESSWAKNRRSAFMIN